MPPSLTKEDLNNLSLDAYFIVVVQQRTFAVSGDSVAATRFLVLFMVWSELLLFFLLLALPH
jgi:hypothetical protein